MNNCTFSGNVGKDATLKTYGDLNVSETTLAVQRRRKDSKSGKYPTDWLFLRVVGHGAERFSRQVKKGDRLTISGELETYKKRDGTDGFNIFVEKFDFPERRNQEEQTEPGAQRSNGWQQQRQQDNPDPFAGSPLEVNEDDLPF